MVLVEPQVTKRSLPGIYRPGAVRAVLALFLVSFLPTPWFATSLPRTATPLLSSSLLEFTAGIPLGLLALAILWRIFANALPEALQGRGGFARQHAAFLVFLIPMVAMAVAWLPLVRWSLMGGYFLGAGGGFFLLLLFWVQNLPDGPPHR